MPKDNQGKGSVPFQRLDLFVQKGGGGQAGGRLGAEEIMHKAREKAAFIEHEAYDKGYAQGEKDGFEFGKHKFQAALQGLTKITHEIDALKSTLYEKYEKEMISLVLAVAKKVICHEASTSPELVGHVIRAAAGYVLENSRVTIRVHPYDFNFVDEVKSDFLMGIAGLKHTEIVEDRGIQQGGCVIETELGDVDATVDQQIAAIEEAMNRVLKRGGR